MRARFFFVPTDREEHPLGYGNPGYEAGWSLQRLSLQDLVSAEGVVPLTQWGCYPAVSNDPKPRTRASRDTPKGRHRLGEVMG